MDVNLINQVVRVGEREWPVSLDVAAGTLAVHLSSATYTVRPLTWGEKRTLARYAFLGEEFLKRQLVMTCATPHPLPDAAGEDQALVLAAAWMAAPEGDHVPLSSGSLLRATTDIERWTGTPASELDRQPAADVEALWRTLASETWQLLPRRSVVGAMPPPRRVHAPASHEAASVAPHSPTPPPLADGWHRILVVPEPAGIAPETSGEPTSEAPTPSTDAGLASPPTSPEWQESSRPSAVFDPEERADATPRRRETANRYRIVFGSADSEHVSAIEAAAPVTASPGPTASPPQPRQTPPPEPPTASPPQARQTPPPELLTGLGTRTIPPLPTRFYRRPIVDLTSSGPTPMSQPPLPSPCPSPTGTDLLDAFAQQLEEAASAVGIDLEG